MAKRQYNKRDSEYWNNRNGKTTTERVVANYAKPKMVEYDSVATASHATGTSLATRSQQYKGIAVSNRFPLIDRGILPFYSISGDCISVAETIELSQKAWANIAIVRNAIESMVEFSNTRIHLKCKNKRALKACKAWLKKINAQKLAEQFFRELYRSGNVFIFRVMGALDTSIKEKLTTLYGYDLSEEGIPVRYIMLNPAYIAVFQGDGVNSYVKVLTPIEYKRLSSSSSQFDKETIKSLNGKKPKGLAGHTLNYIPLDPKHLIPIFYQKQDYDPLAIPLLWGIMDDLELKLQLKEADRAISKTVENIILLITAGAEPDKGGIDPQVLEDLETLFRNKSVQRVLVADYTTKAEFVIPDLQKVLGKDKYEVVNNDIREGLQSMFGVDSKFSNQLTQVKLFLEKLKRGKDEFKRFMEEEMESFCRSMGYRDVPEIYFQDINLKDEIQLQRAWNRLVELGVLTPPEVLEVYQTGILPSKDESIENQEKYKELAEKGLYVPQLGRRANPSEGLPQGRPDGTDGIEQETTDVQALGSTAPNEGLISAEKVGVLIKAAAKLRKSIESAAKKKYRAKKLNAAQLDVIDKLGKSIVASLPEEKWEEGVRAFFESGKLLEDRDFAEKAAKISSDMDLDYYHGGLLVGATV